MPVVFQGTFDPFTNGHLSVLQKALTLFGQVHVLVLVNPNKTPCFSVEERVEMICQATAGLAGVTVDSSSGLLVDYMRPRGWTVCVRGVRNETDAAYELANHHLSHQLYSSLYTFLFPCNEAEASLSSSSVKEQVRQGQMPIDVCPAVARKLQKKFSLR